MDPELTWIWVRGGRGCGCEMPSCSNMSLSKASLAC